MAAASYFLEEYAIALSFFERALNIRQDLLPPNHPDLKDLEEKINTVKKQMSSNIG
jgi:hypothetical protein